jgi:hypothetical protein
LLTFKQDLHNLIVTSLNDISALEERKTSAPEDQPAQGEEEQKGGEQGRNHLANAHAYLRPGVAPALQAARGAQGEADGTAAQEEEEAGQVEAVTVRVPVTSHRTPTSIVSQRLLVYDRYVFDLLPWLAI